MSGFVKKAILVMSLTLGSLLYSQDSINNKIENVDTQNDSTTTEYVTKDCLYDLVFGSHSSMDMTGVANEIREIQNYLPHELKNRIGYTSKDNTTFVIGDFTTTEDNIKRILKTLPVDVGEPINDIVIDTVKPDVSVLYFPDDSYMDKFIAENFINGHTKKQIYLYKKRIAEWEKEYNYEFKQNQYCLIPTKFLLPELYRKEIKKK